MPLPKDEKQDTNSVIRDKVKEALEKASNPVINQLEQAKEQVASKEGLKEIAFKTTGNDPTTAIATGIALGIAGLGVGIGIKGLKKMFSGVKSLMVKSNIENKDESVFLEDDIKETVDNLDVQNNYLKDIDNKLLQSIELLKEQVTISEGILTKAQQERLEKKRKELQKLENELEAIRKQEQILNAIENLSNDNQNINMQENSGSFLKDLIVFRMGEFIGKFFKVSMAFLFKNILKNAVKVALRGFAIVPLVLGVVNGLGDAIKSAIESENVLSAVKNFVVGFIGGFTEAVAGMFGFDIKSENVQKFLNDTLSNIGNLFNEIMGKILNIDLSDGKETFNKIFTRIGQLLLDSGKFILDNVKSVFEDSFENLKSSIGMLGDKLSSWFEDMFSIVRTSLIEFVRNIPGFGDFMMTDKEKKERERNERLKELSNKREELLIEENMIKTKKISKGFLGIGGFSEEERQKQLDELQLEREKINREMNNLLKNDIAKSDTSKRNVIDIIENSKEMGKNNVQIVTVAPTVANNVQSTNVSNSMIAPLSVRNSEATIDRMLASEF